MGNSTSIVIEEAFAKEIGIGVYTAIKILNEAGIAPEDISDISSVCKKILANEIEKRDVPYEFRFLLLNVVLCKMLKTSTAFHKEYMESVKDILDGKDEKLPDIELAKGQ